MASYLLSSPPPVRFKSSAVLVCLVQVVLVFSVSQTTGVTHWKLQDNAITPAATDLSEASTDDLFAMSLASSDPEFAVLLRHATKASPNPAGSTGNRGTSPRSGSPRACPVVSISLDSTQSAGGSGKRDKATGVSSDAAGSCGRQSQCGCRSNGGDVRSSDGVVGGAGGGDTGGGAHMKQPRNPDGSGPM